MNKNKKIMTGLSIGALVFAIVSIFMGFANGIKQEIFVDGELVHSGTAKFWDIIFNKQDAIKGLQGESNAGLIIAFVLTIIVIGILATLVVLNLTGKASQGLNKGLMISSAVILLVLAVLMLFAKGICVIPDEQESKILGITYLYKHKLQAGPICWAVFTLIGGGAMIGAAVINKKNA